MVVAFGVGYLLKPVKHAKMVNPDIFIINGAILIRKLNLGFYPTVTTNYVAFVPFPHYNMKDPPNYGS